MEKTPMKIHINEKDRELYRRYQDYLKNYNPNEDYGQGIPLLNQILPRCNGNLRLWIDAMESLDRQSEKPDLSTRLEDGSIINLPEEIGVAEDAELYEHYQAVTNCAVDKSDGSIITDVIEEVKRRAGGAEKIDKWLFMQKCYQTLKKVKKDVH